MSALSTDQVDFFRQEGYLVVEQVIDPDCLNALWREYTALLDGVAARFHRDGRVARTYAHLPFDRRYTALLGEDVGVFEQLEISLPLENDAYPADSTVHCGPAVFALLTHPPLLDVVESIIGPEIYSNPVQHIRLKPPQRHVPAAILESSYVGKTTWHQDMGALLAEADGTDVLTVWVAVTDAPVDRGCLVAIPRSHHKDALTLHCPGRGITAENYIPEPLLGDGATAPVALPVRRGGIVLLNRYTEHAALPNTSNALRWSFDLRYNPIGQATGRPAFPGFVARSRARPERVLTDPAAWAARWETARQLLVSGAYDEQVYNAARWAANAAAPVCA